MEHRQLSTFRRPAFIPTNSSSFLDRTACVVLVHQNTSDLSFSVLTVGCDNTLLSSFPLPEYTHLIGSVRVSADGGSVFVLSEMVADDSAVDGSWFQFAQYELSSGRLLWEQRDLWEQEWAPQQYFAVGRAGAELLCVILMSRRWWSRSTSPNKQPQQSVKLAALQLCPPAPMSCSSTGPAVSHHSLPPKDAPCRARRLHELRPTTCTCWTQRTATC